MKKKIALLVLCTLVALIGTGCSLENEADVASYNLSEEADNFNIYRKITVMNNQTDNVMLEFEGWCSIRKDNQDNQLEITYRTGENAYAKDFVGLNDRTTYTVTQLEPKNVDKYHYTWLYHSQGDLIPIAARDADKK